MIDTVNRLLRQLDVVDLRPAGEVRRADADDVARWAPRQAGRPLPARGRDGGDHRGPGFGRSRHGECGQGGLRTARRVVVGDP